MAEELGCEFRIVCLVVSGSGSPVIQRRPDVEPVVTEEGVSSVIGRPDVLASRGQTLTLACSAEGSPDPTISWYRNKGQIGDNDHFEVTDGRLTIKKVGRRDEGDFECRAVNTAGQDRETVNVRLAGKTRLDTAPTVSGN